MFHLVYYYYFSFFLSLLGEHADNIANDKTSGAYHRFRSAPEKRDPRSRIIYDDDDDDDDPVTESTTWLSPRRCHLVESILPRDALPAETASYARKRLGTTPCLASIRSSRLAHRVFLYEDLPPVHTGTATLRRENNYRKIRGYTPASCEIRCFFSVLSLSSDRVQT